MTYLEGILLAVIQGLTEFLPISSSAHLILLSEFMGSNQNLFYDVSLHLGTLMAVCIYFRKDLIEIINSVIKYKSLLNNLLLRQLFISCIPTLLLGFIFVDLINGYLRTSTVIACTTIFFGFVLFLATLSKSHKTHIEKITLTDALIIGLAQSLALIPGTSRSGITISAGLLLGLDSKTASKFSFLISIPTIGAIASYQLLSTDLEFLIQYFQINLLGLTVSFVVAYATIDFFIRFINRIGFLPFIVYRIALGIVLFSLILS
jgi:undecaprenyl-diphosphatase